MILQFLILKKKHTSVQFDDRNHCCCPVCKRWKIFLISVLEILLLLIWYSRLQNKRVRRLLINFWTFWRIYFGCEIWKLPILSKRRLFYSIFILLPLNFEKKSALVFWKTRVFQLLLVVCLLNLIPRGI